MRSGFLVLPDHDHDLAVPFKTFQVIPHRSGRPWVLGQWAPGSVIEASHGEVRAVLLGPGADNQDSLNDLVARVRFPGDVDGVVGRLSGSYHLLVSVGGRVRFQGTITGLKRVYLARSSGSAIAANRADLLAAMTNAEIDEQVLAATTVCSAPTPLREMSLWSGVHTVDPDHYVLMDATHASTVRWWYPPEPERSLEVGASVLRDELRAAVANRTPTDGRLGSDLSGGLDSGSLCFLAAQQVPSLLTFRWGEADPGNDDAFYAAQAADVLDQAEHLVVPQHELPTLFEDVGDHDVDLEQPEIFTRTAARIRRTAEILAEKGVSHHLTGHGGDELFFDYPGHLHQMLRRHPLAAIQRLQEIRALQRWPLIPTIRSLFTNSQPRDWWLDQADHLESPQPGREFAKLGWATYSLHAPPWITPHAKDLTRAALRRTADLARPLAADRGQHQCLMQIRTSADTYRQLADKYAASGVRLETPYLDDRVVNAAIAVRFDERATPRQYKPLLTQAMRGVLPQVMLNRSTKGEFSADVRAGFNRNRSRILHYFSDSLLAERGLIDRDRLRMELMAPQANSNAMVSLERIIGCESWLRAATRARA